MVEATEALRAREGELVYESERRLTAALLEAWTKDPGANGAVRPADPQLAAPLIAGIWLTAGRILIVENRSLVADGADPRAVAASVERLADQLFTQMESAFAVVVNSPAGVTTDTGWPRTEIRRAG